ncbi:MAG: DNA primase [Kiritimatiellaeota bacterium]|nr:DNA primase [Kiritimatiellota bacterium]
MAGKFTDSALDEIRARVDIVEFIGARVALKRAGASYKGCCPFHGEKTPSFHVNPARQRYHCFGCGEDGDVFTFLMKLDGLAFMDAVRLLADRAGVALKENVDDTAQVRNRLYALHAELAAFYQRCLRETRAAETARKYLADRGLSDDTVKAFGIGYAPARPRDALVKWGEKYGYGTDLLVAAGALVPPRDASRPDDFYHRFSGRLMFPVCDRQGRVVAFSGRVLDPKAHPAKYVNSPETDIFIKSRVLYALDKAAAKIVKHPRREAIICEGQIDVIRCHACGLETAVAAQGTAFTEEHVALLKRHADSVVLAFDGDAAGGKAALRTGALFLAAEIPVRVAQMPEGEDPDSLLRKQGAAAFRDLLENAVSITQFQVAALRKAEANPDSIDALNRVSRGVIEMLAACSSAVQRSHLTEEAARLLHLPLSAFEEDLERHREHQRQQAAYRASFKAEEPPPDDFAPEEDAPPDLDAPPPPEPPSRTEFLLCEFLVEHEHDAEVLALVEKHLPPELLRHTFTRAVMSAVMGQHRDGGDKVAGLGATVEPEWQTLLGNIIANKQKMMSARERTPLDAAKGLITRLWIDALQQTRDRLDAHAAESDMPRLSLSAQIHRLKSEPWERACQLMMLASLADPAMAYGAAAGRDASGAPVSAHEADSAYAAADPGGLPPSESPPDEMPD